MVRDWKQTVQESGGITMPGTIQRVDAALGDMVQLWMWQCWASGDISSLLQPKWFYDPIKSKM